MESVILFVGTLLKQILLFLPAVVLGVVMGGNDAGNLLGPTVANGIFKAKKTILLCAFMIIFGSLLGGGPGIRVTASLIKTNLSEAVIINISATLITLFFLLQNLPISMTQAIIGATVGVGILTKTIETKVLLFIVIGWFLTPVSAYVIGFTVFEISSVLFKKIKKLQVRTWILKILLWAFTLYGAYTTGANNAGKITGVLYGKGYNIYLLLIVSGLSLAIGVVFLGKRTIYTVGRELVQLDDFSATVVVLSTALTIGLFSIIGLPISSAHAIVGSILGIAWARGTKVSNAKVFKKIIFSWLEAPLFSGIFSVLIYSLFKILW